MMQRYDLAGEPWAIKRLADGEYVRFDDAEAEIKKARTEGWLTTPQAEAEIGKAREEGRKEGRASRDISMYDLGIFATEAAVRCEREEIVKELETRFALGGAIAIIRARGEKKPVCTCGISTPCVGLAAHFYKKPGKIEYLEGLSFGDFRSMSNRINELIDAVNEMRVSR